jgi:hypothetical protein
LLRLVPLNAAVLQQQEAAVVVLVGVADDGRALLADRGRGTRPREKLLLIKLQREEKSASRSGSAQTA